LNSLKIRLKKSKLLILLVIPIVAITLISSIGLIIYANLNSEDSGVSVSDELVTCLVHADCGLDELCIDSNLGKTCSNVVCDSSTICPNSTNCVFFEDENRGFCKYGETKVLGIEATKTVEHSSTDFRLITFLSISAILLFVFIDSKRHTFKNLLVKNNGQ
jgi:hypothetical protein